MTPKQKLMKRREYRRAYYDAHRLEECERSRAYYAAHREEVCARLRAYYEARCSPRKQILALGILV